MIGGIFYTLDRRALEGLIGVRQFFDTLYVGACYF